ncbi:MAG: sugar-binding transcriptional regulator [Lutisporaceae bacterium]|jgi:deoxyribonucleoside regulator
MKKLMDDMRLILKCCTLYYEDDLNQEQIAKELGISRPTVSRMLKEAKDQGIVEIKINSPINSDFHSIERKLEKLLGLKEVIVVDNKKDSVSQKIELGYAAARYLERVLKDRDIVGVSMGTTIKEIAKFVNKSSMSGVTFLPIVGGVGQVNIDIHPNQIVMDLARAFGGNYKLLHVPAVISDIEVKENLKKEKEIKQILDFIDKVTVAIVGIGVPTEKTSTMMTSGYFNESDMEVLRMRKAVGDVCLQFYDINGDASQFEFNKKVFGIEISRLKEIDRVVGVAGSMEKANAVIGAARGKYINVLVTNHQTSEVILNKYRGN